MKVFKGDVFGNLKIIKSKRSRLGNSIKTVFECQCVCGNVVDIRSGFIEKRKDLSCGCVKKQQQLKKQTTGYSSDKRIYYKYKDSAKIKNRDFSLDFGTFTTLIHSNCFYCNSAPRNGVGNLYNGIDRKENNIGYTKTNCVSCCKVCNFLKGKINYNDFLNIINKIFLNINCLPSTLDNSFCS